ncbi:hypothetical protein IJ670_04270, partial [bacterium]|nr:hypothetical protein [bacterium]
KINIPYNSIEWKLLKRNISPKITRYFTFSEAFKSAKNTKGILIMNKNQDSFDEIFNKLSDLFYYISDVVLKFKQ